MPLEFHINIVGQGTKVPSHASRVRVRDYSRINQLRAELSERMKSSYKLEVGVLNNERYPPRRTKTAGYTSIGEGFRYSGAGPQKVVTGTSLPTRYTRGGRKGKKRKVKKVAQIAFFLEYGTKRIEPRYIFRDAIRFTEFEHRNTNLEDPNQVGQDLVDDIRAQIQETKSIDTRRFFNSISYKFRQRGRTVKAARSSKGQRAPQLSPAEQRAAFFAESARIQGR